MNGRAKGPLIAALWLTFSLAQLPASAADVQGQVNEASKLLDIPRGLELASAKLRKSFKVEGSPAAQAKAQAILQETFHPIRLRIAVERGLAASADSATLAEAMRFLKSPLARKLSTMAAEAGPKIATQIQPYATSLSANPPPAARVEIVRRIIRSTRHVETAAMMSINPLYAVGTVLGRECGKTAPPHPESAKLRDLQVGKIRQSAQVVLLFMYQPATDTELDEYADWFESSAGQRFVGLTADAIAKVLDDAAETTGRRIAREVMRGNVTWCP